MVVKQCLHCAGEFKTYKAWLRKSPGAGRFCSRKCSYLAKQPNDGLTAGQRCYRKNQEKRRAQQRAKYVKNKDKETERHRRYIEANREHINAQLADRRRNDLQFRLKNVLRCRLRSAVRNKRRGTNGGSAIRDLGCSVASLKNYIEERFLPGMTWENWGKIWHIDHKIAFALVDLAISQNVKLVCHYTNLQPLFIPDHHVKTALDRAAARKIRFVK